MKKALLVGINDYPLSPLKGCVNDVEDMANFLVSSKTFQEKEIRLLVDKRATTEAIIERLNWLVEGAKEGDKLFFHYSGHGVQLPTRNKQGEVDGLDEAICPVDFDWSTTKVIRDKDFIKIFKNVPKGVDFLWISDSCHSGDLSRNISSRIIKGIKPPEHGFTAIRSIRMPLDIQWRLNVALLQKIPQATFIRAAQELNLALITACRSDQTAADAVFGNRYNGAFTYFLIKILKKKDGVKMPLNELTNNVRIALKQKKFSQEPQLEGSQDIINKPFFLP